MGQSLKEGLTADSHGAIVRGDTTGKKIVLVFTGHTFADGASVIYRVLRKHRIKGAFFLTGDFYRMRSFSRIIKQLKAAGHYLGAHSDKHLLYCDWSKRDSLLVTREEFMDDLEKNYREMARFGINKQHAPYFLPPYEWYNKSIAAWTAQQGLVLVNFSQGTLSAADYTCPDMGARYRTSENILHSIMAYEQTSRHGLNGFLLLTHLGTAPCRIDKFYHHLDALIVSLNQRGYSFVSLPAMLSK